MATGPEHYREAEEWLDASHLASENKSEIAVELAIQAQAHALLAVAAAVIGKQANASDFGWSDLREWADTLFPKVGDKS